MISIIWLTHSIFSSTGFLFFNDELFCIFSVHFFLPKVLYLVLSSFKPHTEFASFPYLVIILLKFNSGIQKKNKVKNIETKQHSCTQTFVVWLDKILYLHQDKQIQFLICKHNILTWKETLRCFCVVCYSGSCPTRCWEAFCSRNGTDKSGSNSIWPLLAVWYWTT